MLPSAYPTTSAPHYSLSRLVTTACTLAVYASWLDDSLVPRKTRFRWVASPCRVGLGPTGSTAKGFRLCLLHDPFPPSQASPGARDRLYKTLRPTAEISAAQTSGLHDLIIPIYPLLTVVSTMLYYDLRIRKEGFDLEIMSRELGGSATPVPAT